MFSSGDKNFSQQLYIRSGENKLKGKKNIDLTEAVKSQFAGQLQADN